MRAITSHQKTQNPQKYLQSWVADDSSCTKKCVCIVDSDFEEQAKAIFSDMKITVIYVVWMMKLTIFNSVIIQFSNVSALKGAFLKDPVWLDIQTGFIINLTEKNKTVKIHTQYTWPGNPNEIWLNRNRIYKKWYQRPSFLCNSNFFCNNIPVFFIKTTPYWI